MAPVRIAVAGAGLIGKRHIEEVDASRTPSWPRSSTPARPGRSWPRSSACRSTRRWPSCSRADKPDGVILATPNQMHVDGGLECVAAGVPVIVEKPIGDTVEARHPAGRGGRGGRRAGADRAPPQLQPDHGQGPRDRAAAARLGPIVAVVGTALFYKPDDYFDVGGGWRRQPGGGPILLNLIHEVNNLLSLVGDIVRVQAVTSNATRGFPVEDTAAMVFTFANGALGTFLLSDTAASPRSLGADLAGEHELRQLRRRGLLPHRRHQGVAVGADHAAQGLRRHSRPGGSRSTSSTEAVERSDPLANQVAHFAAVIRGEAAADLQRPRRPEDAEGGRRGHRGRPHRRTRRRHHPLIARALSGPAGRAPRAALAHHGRHQERCLRALVRMRRPAGRVERDTRGRGGGVDLVAAHLQAAGPGADHRDAARAGERGRPRRGCSARSRWPGRCSSPRRTPARPRCRTGRTGCPRTRGPARRRARSRSCRARRRRSRRGTGVRASAWAYRP